MYKNSKSVIIRRTSNQLIFSKIICRDRRHQRTVLLVGKLSFKDNRLKWFQKQSLMYYKPKAQLQGQMWTKMSSRKMLNRYYSALDQSFICDIIFRHDLTGDPQVWWKLRRVKGPTGLNQTGEGIKRCRLSRVSLMFCFVSTEQRNKVSLWQNEDDAPRSG